MIKRKAILTLLGASLLFLTVTCQRNKPLIKEQPDYPRDNTGWTWRELGFAGKNVQGVQIDEDGNVFVLSGGRLFSLKGDKWHDLQLDTPISAFCVTRDKDDTVVIAGGNNGMIYTCPRGDGDWDEALIDALHGPINIIVKSPSTGDVFVGQSSKNGGGLWKSTDRGINWQKLTDITVRGIAVHPEEPDIIYIVDKLTYRSSDGGRSWVKVETGANYGVLIHPLYPDTAYLAYGKGVVTIGHDGEIISQQRFYLDGDMTRLEFNPASTSEWALGIWDYPSGVGGLYYTLNSGAHWLELADEIKDIRILDLCYSNDGKRLYIGTADKGLWVLNLEEL